MSSGAGAAALDKLARSKENQARLLNIEKCFGNVGKSLYIPGRVLVGEGVLTKMCRKKPKPRQFFLCNDIIIYGHIVVHKKKYSHLQIIHLSSVSVKDIPNTDELSNGWLIISPSKSFAVYAMTELEKEEWMSHINRFAEELRKAQGKTLKESELAAVWVPDSQTSVCMVCETSKFTPINRRHHCRQCGKVVCDSCSGNRYILPNIDSKPVRVCDICFNKLKIAGDSEAQDSTVGSGDEDDGDNPVYAQGKRASNFFGENNINVNN